MAKSKKTKGNSSIPTKPKYPKDLVTIYRVFKEQVYNPKSVLHPCCAYDASPSKVFDNVTYVDIDEASMEMFRRFGLKAFGQDIKTYQPTEEYDLVIILNPGVSTESITQHLKQGGYVLSNDYHANATWMHEHPEQFLLWGTIDLITIDVENEKYEAVVSRDLEGLFEPFASEEEMKRLAPERYEFYSSVIKNFRFGNTSDERYEGFLDTMKGEMHLPSKRNVSRYIFIKK